jgi:hypothetical protein
MTLDKTIELDKKWSRLRGLENMLYAALEHGKDWPMEYLNWLESQGIEAADKDGYPTEAAYDESTIQRFIESRR